MPVFLPGCHATDPEMGHVPGHNSGATRMQDEAGQAPADRRW